MQIIIPKQVIQELKKITESKKKLHFRDDAELSLKLLEKNSFEEIDVRGFSDVDKAIIKFAEKNKEVIVATLDKEIKKSVTNMKLIIRGKKKLEVI